MKPTAEQRRNSAGSPSRRWSSRLRSSRSSRLWSARDQNARAEFRLQTAARLFATYIEKARADSIRRHGASGKESSIETFGAGNKYYAITMDFGSGLVETRKFKLEPGIDFHDRRRKSHSTGAAELLSLGCSSRVFQ